MPDDPEDCTCPKCQMIDLIADLAHDTSITEALGTALQAVAEVAAATEMRGKTTRNLWNQFLLQQLAGCLAREEELSEQAAAKPGDRIRPTAPSSDTVQ